MKIIISLGAPRLFESGAMGGEMTQLRWLKTFETGVAEIDEDHRCLVEMIQEIQKAFEDGAMDRTPALAAGFLGQVKAHFTREEAFLKRAEFPGLEEHSREHRKLLTKTETLMRMCEKAADREALDDTLEDLIAFLLGDLIETDVNLKSYLQDFAHSHP